MEENNLKEKNWCFTLETFPPPFVTVETIKAGGNEDWRKPERDERQSGKQHLIPLRPSSINILVRL